MIIPENYILSNEIAEKGNIHVANFSMFLKDIEHRNIKDTIIKYGNSTFINKNSAYLPNNFSQIINKNTFTNLKNSTLVSYFCSEFECSLRDLEKSGIVAEFFTVGKKKFARFNNDFVKQIKGKVITNIPASDIIECQDDIDSFVMLSKNNYLVWY